MNTRLAVLLARVLPGKVLLASAAACLAVMLAMPVQAESRSKPAGIDTGNGTAQTADVSSQRRYYRRYYGPRRVYWGPRRYWGPRYRYWGPRRAYWGPRYWGPRRAYWGPRYRYWGPRYAYWGPRRAWWGPRYYWRPRPAFWGPRYYWGGPVISVGFGPRWWW